jgi:hypothetical protein
MTIRAHKKSVVLLALVLAQTAQAGSLNCTGTIAQLAYHQPDTLYIRLTSMNTVVSICSVDVVWVIPGSLAGNTSVSACKTMYAALLAAKVADRSVNVFLMDGDAVPASCTGFAAWTSVNVRYWEL